jgi:hypothetical protein
MLFDTFDATDLNKELKALMEGLSVKVGHVTCHITNEYAISLMSSVMC